MLEKNKIYNMDCIEFLQKIEDNSINLIITSPPYNLDIEYDSCNDNLPWDDYLKWCENWLKECYRVLKDDGRICINHYIAVGRAGYEKKSEFPLMDFRNIQKKIGFNVHKIAIWSDTTISKLTAWGSWLSASSPYINTPYEGILISYKNQWKKQNKGISTITKNEFIEGVSGVWKIQPDTKSLTKASFPVKLPERCINLLTYKNDLVLDPFIGSGTTAIAAKKTERNFIGCELSSNYCEIAEKRLKEFKREEKNKQKYKMFFGD